MYEFIQLIYEEIDDEDDNIFVSLVEHYSLDNKDTEDTEQEPKDEVDIKAELVNITEALKALETIKL